MAYNTFEENASLSENDDDNVSVNSAPTPYSSFTVPQKRTIIALTAFVSIFSPLSSSIYFPAITYLSDSLSVSIELINLTITSYMIVSGIAPTLLGDLADQLGRRPIFLLVLIVYVGANVGLACQSSYAALLVLRMVQSFGSSATIAIAYGVISDFASPAERGAVIGLVFVGPNMAPLLGPVLGGALAQYFGWRSIFWFLVILAGTCFILLTLFFPETSRRIVGNGSIPATGLNRTLSSILWPSQHLKATSKEILIRRRFRIPSPMTSFEIIFHKDTALIMTAHGIFYMVFSCIQASLSSLFMERYGFTGMEAGLIYLPLGAGCVLASYFTGKMLNRDYRVTAKAHNFVIDEVRGDDLSKFPIEKARLRSVWYTILMSTACISGYGWAVERKMTIIIPLVFQFFIGVGTVAIFNALQTLLVDLHPDSPATAQAGLNMVRASLAAAGTAALQLILDAVGVGWCFTIFAGICLATIPILWMENEWGMGWRLAKGQPISLEVEEEPLLV